MGTILGNHARDFKIRLVDGGRQSAAVELPIARRHSVAVVDVQGEANTGTARQRPCGERLPRMPISPGRGGRYPTSPSLG